jgi:hypothetical protein
MSSKIILKKSSVVSKVPQPSDLDYGELAINYSDGRVYYKSPANTVESFAAQGTEASYLTVNHDTSYTTSGNESAGTTFWDDDNNTISTALNGVTLQHGQELYYDVINQTGSTLNQGSVAKFNGSIGMSGKLSVGLGSADETVNALTNLGVVTENIANGDTGKVTWFGKVRGIDTTGGGENWQQGDILYVSADTQGALTKIKPTAPDHDIAMAVVVTVHANVGEIFVRPTFAGRLTDLDDVRDTNLADNTTPVYNSTDQVFDFVNLDNIYLTNNDFSTFVCHLKSNVNSSIAQGSSNEFTVNFNIEEHNDTNFFNHSNGVITVLESGWYRIYANMVYENSTSSARNTIRAYVKKNGNQIVSTRTYDYDRGASYGRFSNNKIETMLYLNANDTVEIANYAFNEDGSVTIQSEECEFIVNTVSVQTISNNSDTVDGLHASAFLQYNTVIDLNA